MSGKEKKKNIQVIILAVCCIILLVLLIVILVLSMFFMKKKEQDTGDVKENSTQQVIQGNDEVSKEETPTESAGIVNSYTAAFKVQDASNRTNVEKTLMIMDARMKSFGMVGESTCDDDYISISVGILDSSQEKYLKYIATPGEFKIITDDGRTILSDSMIESHEMILETVEDENDVAGELDLNIKDEFVDKFRENSKYAVGRNVYITVDDNTIIYFKWSTEVKSGKLVLRCFNKEWLKALDAIFSSGKIPVTLTVVDARSSSMQE